MFIYEAQGRSESNWRSKTIEKPWKNHRKPIENHRKTIENSRNTWHGELLSGRWYTYPPEKYESQLGSLFPI